MKKIFFLTVIQLLSSTFSFRTIEKKEMSLSKEWNKMKSFIGKMMIFLKKILIFLFFAWNFLNQIFIGLSFKILLMKFNGKPLLFFLEISVY
jgi:hypothetical protein